MSGGSFVKGRGCSLCNQTGYKGRIGIFELSILDNVVRDAILDNRTSYEIRRLSIENAGLVTLLEDGLVKAGAGITSIEEVLRCLPKLSTPRPLSVIQRLSDMVCHKLAIGVTEIANMDVASVPEVKLLGLSELDLAELEIMLEDKKILWQ